MNSSKTFVISPPEENQGAARTCQDVLTEAHYLFVPVPFQTTHTLIVNITVVPFSIPSHRGQVFYQVEASYAQCCQGLDREAFMRTIIRIAQRAHSIYMPSHPWNFEVPGIWQQLHVPQEIVPESLRCWERSASMLRYLVDPSESVPDEEDIQSLACDTMSGFKQHLCSNEDAGSTSGVILAEQIGEWPMHDAESPPIQYEQCMDGQPCPVTKVVDEFLDSFHNKESFGRAIKLKHGPSNSHLPENMHFEPAMEAFKCCKLVAIEARGQLKHATFTRFTSLCFFLIWKTFACEPGKAGARVINARMREAGFEGTSRSLKNLRDETVFINHIVASVEACHGTGIASLVFHHIFESSNYRLVRFMNRYSRAKKLLAIQRICENVNVNRQLGAPLPILRIHDLIGEHMPILPDNVISAAIGYLDIQTLLAIDSGLE